MLTTAQEDEQYFKKVQAIYLLHKLESYKHLSKNKYYKLLIRLIYQTGFNEYVILIEFNLISKQRNCKRSDSGKIV